MRELVEFACRTGDLGSARDFLSPKRMVAGIRGHQKVQRSRPAPYEKEVPLSHEINAGDFLLRVQGRLDGRRASEEEVLIEEIKTVEGDWDEQPSALHWAQLKCYGFMHFSRTRPAGAEGSPAGAAGRKSEAACILLLTYLHLETGKELQFKQPVSIAELEAFFQATTQEYVAWIRDLNAWRRARDTSIAALQFPFPAYRPGQRELAIAVYRACTRGERVFIEAPTGIGKTISVLFPALKTLGEGRLERVYYLTARTVGRTVAEKAVDDLRGAGLKLRALTLTAKEKICPQDICNCEATSCPFARGYYDRVKPAMREALENQSLTRTVLEEIGRKHQVCPHELSLDLSLWVDLVIGDYNYLFDPQACLRRHFSEETGDFAFLIDEAHNLVDRAREMFSAEFGVSDIQPVRRALHSQLPRLARALSRLSGALRKLAAGPGAEREDLPEAAGPVKELDLFSMDPANGQPEAANPPESARAGGWQFEEITTLGETSRVSREFPEGIAARVDAVLEEAEAWLAKNQPAAFRQELLDLYFRLLSFRRTAEAGSEGYMTLLDLHPSPRLRLFCLDPSRLLREAVSRGKAALFFSATLTPIEFFRELLGGTLEDRVFRLTSPFPPNNLALLVEDTIRTDFKSRSDTVSEVVQAIHHLVTARRGNYLVYFPSYQYLSAVETVFRDAHPQIVLQVQRPGLTEPEKEQFLAAFSRDHNQALVGFAVMGGMFGEGIDLVGERLIGAVIVGVGLPQVSLERDLIRRYFDEKEEPGFHYAYTFPGMNRVLQATGRVIRTENDRGAVLLIDKRFAEQRYLRLFPEWWQVRRVRSAAEIEASLADFWNSRQVGTRPNC